MEKMGQKISILITQQLWDLSSSQSARNRRCSLLQNKLLFIATRMNSTFIRKNINKKDINLKLILFSLKQWGEGGGVLLCIIGGFVERGREVMFVCFARKVCSFIRKKIKCAPRPTTPILHISSKLSDL